MINYTKNRINNKLNKLNPRFTFLDFTFIGIVCFSVLESLFYNSFVVKTLQIQFYNLQANKGNPTIKQSQNEHYKKGKNAASVQFVDNFAIGFDTILFLRNFKIPI